MPEHLQWALDMAIQMPCFYCQTAPGKWCRIKGTDRKAFALHLSRSAPLRILADKAYRKGWTDYQQVSKRI